MLSTHLILCCPLLLCPSVSFRAEAALAQSTGASASASVLQENIQGWFPLIDWFDLLAVQRTLKSLL